MSEPTIQCPKCQTEIRVSESLAAPLVAGARRELEQRFAAKEQAFAAEALALRGREEALAKERESFDRRAAETLKQERSKIAAEEAKKARLALQGDLEQKQKDVAELQELLKLRNEKLAEAQKAQAELLKKERALADERRELELSVEKRVREGLGAAQERARKDAEERLKPEMLGLQAEIEKARKRESELSKREAEIRTAATGLAKERETLERQAMEKAEEERVRIALEERKKVKLALGADLDQKAREIAELHDVVKERDLKLAQAQSAQAELARRERELADAKRELELTVEKRVLDESAAVREQAGREADERAKLKLQERELLIGGLQKQIEELKRKAEQGSQQLQGEVQELELEASLRAKFPRDTIEPVPKGELGGDVFQRVLGPLNQACGTILWETKRTKGWSENWLPKLRDDQRKAKAEIAAIVSHTLPKGVETFELVDQVWVIHPRAALAVAAVLRQTLVEVSMARQASHGQETKKEMLYEYMTGIRFRQRIQAVIEAFSSMKDDLEKEKRAILKQWAKRDEQLMRAIEAAVGMRGDLEGIAGKTLLEVEGLELPALDGPAGETAKAATLKSVG